MDAQTSQRSGHRIWFCDWPAGGFEPEADESSSPILQCGQTCWRIESAEQAAFLIDGDAYFRAFREVAVQANQTLYRRLGPRHAGGPRAWI